MTFLCLKCGHINEKNNTWICKKCHEKTNSSDYKKLSKYARDAAHFGYNYRTKYEKQLEDYGKIRYKYSLLLPSNYYELIALSVLAGSIGNFAYDILKHVVKQILNKLKKKKTLTKDEKQVINLISDSKRLSRFSIYINDYSQGMASTDEKVRKEIVDEEFVNSYSKELASKVEKMFKRGLKKKEFQKEFAQAHHKAIKKARKRIKSKTTTEKINSLLLKSKKSG